MVNFQLLNKLIEIQNPSKTVESVEVKLVMDNVSQGQVHVTDLMLQGGQISTVWGYHPSELRWSHDG